MPKQHLNRQQILLRTLFMLAVISLISWFLPHNEAFRYEYEVGKPWRYGRLTAPYDFPIYRNDSAVMQMEDSLRRQIVPRFEVDASVAPAAIRDLTRRGDKLNGEAMQHLQEVLGTVYGLGIVSGRDYDEIIQLHASEAILISGGQIASVPASRLLSERQAYELIRNDSLYAQAYAAIGLSQFIRTNLIPDSAAMQLEYSRLRQQVSVTSGVVLAESRIIDQGEIVTPHIYDVLESYRREQQQRLSLASSDTLMYLGRLLLVALVLCSVLVFFRLYRNWFYVDQTSVLVTIGAISLMVILTSLANKQLVGGVYLVPIGIVTILLSTFLGSRTAYYSHIVMVLLCSFIAPSHFEYLIIQCLVGMVIVFSLKDGLEKRQQLMHVSILSALTYTGVYALYTLATEGTLSNISLPILTMMVADSILLLLAYLIIYAFENIFGFTSAVTLVELCNMGQGLLLKLSQEAPGTFQHSMQVANLAANAAEVIGADHQLVRTGALYHDIGKLWNPRVYVENQQGVSPHDGFTIEESVISIKKHVEEGVRMAEREHLPRVIIDFIKTHHGCSMVRYFYVQWCNEHPDEQPDEGFFSYTGPDPETTEQAILMMADAVEAATRSLSDFSTQSITNLVDNIIRGMVASGRFNNAKISLRDIHRCRQSFISDLQTIHHVRIAYPELKK